MKIHGEFRFISEHLLRDVPNKAVEDAGALPDAMA
jgi:hypothetical protein